MRCFILLCLLCSAARVRADDWPQWRGEGRRGVWSETDLLERFPSGGPPVKWRVPVGSGYSGPTVADGRVFLTDRLLDPQRERVRCFDAEDGKLLWEQAYECVYRVGYPAGPRACVTVDGDVCYSFGAMGDLLCLKVADGEVVWRRDLNAEYGIVKARRMPIWGLAAAPLVVGDVLIVQAAAPDKCVLGFDTRSGQERWGALADRGSYSAPILIEQAGRQVAVVWTGDSVTGLAPAGGEVLWSFPFPSLRMPIGIATPVVNGDRMFITSFYDGSLMLRLKQDELGVEKLWRRRGENERRTDALHSIISTPVFLNEHLYGVDSYGELRCLQAADGDRVWEDRTATIIDRWSTIHFVPQGDRIWMFNERGELIIAKLSPQGYEELDRAKILEPTLEQLPRRDGVCWSHPAFARRCCFVRNDEELVCVDLARQ